MSNSVKQTVKGLLLKKDYDLLVDKCIADKKYWQEVRFRLYDIDERIQWAAIETVARVMQHWWKSGDKEMVKNYIRTLFWSMTDESGGIGWSAPQSIAEIIANIPELIDPYGSMMIAYSIDEQPLVKSGLWGIGRLGRKITESVEFFKDKIFKVFQSEDVEILGLAVWAMGEARFKPALPFLQNLRGIDTAVRIYEKGDFREKSLESWTNDAIAKINEILFK